VAGGINARHHRFAHCLMVAPYTSQLRRAALASLVNGVKGTWQDLIDDYRFVRSSVAGLGQPGD
jgi:hypothetical protein